MHTYINYLLTYAYALDIHIYIQYTCMFRILCLNMHISTVICIQELAAAKDVADEVSEAYYSRDSDVGFGRQCFHGLNVSGLGLQSLVGYFRLWRFRGLGCGKLQGI